VSLYAHVASARTQLRAAGIPHDEAALDARLMAQHVLQWDATRYFANGDQAAPATFPEPFHALLARRLRREPMAYVLGHREFWGLDLEVTSDVLIPRPESELIVEAVLKHLPDADAATRIVDVGTGSGCLAIAIAGERPRAQLTASDISPAALRVAERNAARHLVAARMRFMQADMLEGVDGPFDVIVANPPYVPDLNRKGMQLEVRKFEPEIALFGGPQGLDLIERLVAQAATRLAANGLLVFEFGLGQDDEIEQLISRTPALTMIDIVADLQAIPRVAVARLTASI
jgi:release factor glutamine methyltransferase